MIQALGMLIYDHIGLGTFWYDSSMKYDFLKVSYTLQFTIQFICNLFSSQLEADDRT